MPESSTLRHLDFLKAVKYGKLPKKFKTFIFVGEEIYLIQASIKRILELFNLKERRIYWADETPAETILEQISQPEFMRPPTLFIVRSAENINEINSFITTLNRIPEIVIIETHDLRKAHQRWIKDKTPRVVYYDTFASSLSKTLTGQALIVTFPPLSSKEEKQFRNWAMRRLMEEKVNIGGPVLDYLFRRISRNLTKADNDIRKLGLFGRSKPIDTKTIDLLVMSDEQEDIFQILDLIITAVPEKAIHETTKFLKRGESPHTLLSLLSQALMDMLSIKLGLPVAKPRRVIQKYTRTTKRLSEHDIVTMLRLVLSTEKKMRSVYVDQHNLVISMISRLVWSRSFSS